MINGRAKIVRFPIEQIEASLMAKDHIDIAFHEPQSRAEGKPFKAVGKLPQLLAAAEFCKCLF